MVLELVLIVAILGIFIIIVRKLPDALREGQVGPTASVNTKPTVASSSGGMGWLSALTSRMWQGSGKRPKPVAPAPTVLLAKQADEVITEDSLLAEGDGYLEAGKFKEAERAYLGAVAKNPKNPKLYNRLGAIYLKQRNYSDALQAFEAARDLDGSKASRHYNVALAAWQLGNLGKAREAISQAISLDPEAKKYHELKQQIEGGAA